MRKLVSGIQPSESQRPGKPIMSEYKKIGALNKM